MVRLISFLWVNHYQCLINKYVFEKLKFSFHILFTDFPDTFNTKFFHNNNFLREYSFTVTYLTNLINLKRNIGLSIQTIFDAIDLY